MKQQKIACSEVHKERWGLITNVTLPSGGTIGVYEPLHVRPRAPELSRGVASARPAARPRTSGSKPKRKK